MAAPALNPIPPTVLRAIDPAAASTRGFYAHRQRPFVAGYKIRAEATAAHKLVGVNHPGTMVGGFPVGSLNQNTGGTAATYSSPANKVFATVGKGDSALQLTNGFENYTISTTGDFVVAPGCTATVPQDTDLTDATNYANAILIAYPLATKDRGKTILFTRIAKSGSLAASGTWKVNNATSIDVCWDYNATPANSRGVPNGFQLVLILPSTSTDVVTLLDNASAGQVAAITACDFMFSGKTSQAGVVTVSRLLQ